MPFKKVGPDKYTSPSGRHFNAAQVRLYYAHGGSFPGQKAKEEPEPKKEHRTKADYYEDLQRAKGGLK